MLKRLSLLSSPSGGRRRRKSKFTTGIAAIFCLTIASPSHAQVFRIPDSCEGRATGSEDELDPVAIIGFDAGNKVIQGVSPTQTVLGDGWFVALLNPEPGAYSFFTTYTPFLTSEKSEVIDTVFKVVQLPAPGFSSGGTKWHIFPTFELSVSIDGAGGDPNADGFVDFIPYFPGSSPFTMQLDASGEVTLHCVQAVNPYYEIAVYDADGNYLYDGYFQTTTASADARAYGLIGPEAQGTNGIHPNSWPAAEQSSSLKDLPERVFMKDIGGLIKDGLLIEREAVEAGIGAEEEGARGDPSAASAPDSEKSDPEQ